MTTKNDLATIVSTVIPPPALQGTERLLSRRQLAERWGCCTETIKRMEVGGVLKPIRFNSRNLRYTYSSVLAVEQMAKGGE
jgi:hypothetical protein